MIDKASTIKRIVDFTVEAVGLFINRNPNLEFYAFAFDCNAEYTEINLCFNTEKDFKNTLSSYQGGEYSEYYQNLAQIKELKFNTGDWRYQSFDTLYLLTDTALDELFQSFPDDDCKSWSQFLEELMELFCESLLAFIKTEAYAQIPKSIDFVIFCIDHDEDFTQAENRLNKIRLISK
jgi:hypothetical protein